MWLKQWENDLLIGYNFCIGRGAMKKVLKGIGFVLLGLVVILGIALAVFYGIGNKRLNANFTVPVENQSSQPMPLRSAVANTWSQSIVPAATAPRWKAGYFWICLPRALLMLLPSPAGRVNTAPSYRELNSSAPSATELASTENRW